jgi:hypothetical protein
MSIITISRGTLSGGKMLAESLSARLGYRCVDRDALIEGAVTRRASQQDLLTAMQAPPAGTGRPGSGSLSRYRGPERARCCHGDAAVSGPGALGTPAA